MGKQSGRPEFLFLATGQARSHTVAMRPLSAAASLGLLVATVSFAGPREIVNRDHPLLCDSERWVCLRGTLSYYANPRLLELRSRVQVAEGPGVVSIRVVGENAEGFTRLTTLEVRIRGIHSEIVNTKLITDHPDVYHWRLDSISFEPDSSKEGDDR